MPRHARISATPVTPCPAAYHAHYAPAANQQCSARASGVLKLHMLCVRGFNTVQYYSKKAIWRESWALYAVVLSCYHRNVARRAAASSAASWKNNGLTINAACTAGKPISRRPCPAGIIAKCDSDGGSRRFIDARLCGVHSEGKHQRNSAARMNTAKRRRPILT